MRPDDSLLVTPGGEPMIRDNAPMAVDWCVVHDCDTATCAVAGRGCQPKPPAPSTSPANRRLCDPDLCAGPALGVRRCVHGREYRHSIADEDRRCEADDRTAPIKVFVTETIEFEITVDPTQPDWEWLQDSARADWVGELDHVASETEGPVEAAIKAAGCTGAWREVTHP